MENRFKKSIHIILWLVFIGILFSSFGQRIRILETPTGVVYNLSYDYGLLLILVLDVISKIVMFYLNVYLFRTKSSSGKKNHRYKKIWFVVIFLSTQLFSILAWWLSALMLSEALDTADTFFDYMLPYSFCFHFLIFFLSLGYSFYLDNKKNEEIRKILAQENLVTELKLLKSQINPHFLFNTLNNIYSLARKHEDPKAAASIAQLSRLMRYMIYDGNLETVPLHLETAYIRDYISLEKMRLPNPDILVMRDALQGENLPNIAPMLLIPFVENAIKHGVGRESDQIEIDMAFVSGQFLFKVSNKIIHLKVPHRYQGFGLENVKRRLNLIYPDRHKLTVTQSEKYIVELKLNLVP